MTNQCRESIQKILVYLLECFGFIATDALHLFEVTSPLGDMLDLTLDEQTRETFVENNYALLRSVFAGFFQEHSQERGMIVGFLKNNGFLASDINDPLRINRQIIATMLHYLARGRLVTHCQAADLLIVYPTYERNIEQFIDAIFELIKNNAVVAVGGFAGGFAGSFVANYILKKYCPAVGASGPVAT